MRCFQCGLVDGQRLLQARVVARGEQFEMLIDDDERQRFRRGFEPVQLQ